MQKHKSLALKETNFEDKGKLNHFAQKYLWRYCMNTASLSECFEMKVSIEFPHLTMWQAFKQWPEYRSPTHTGFQRTQNTVYPNTRIFVFEYYCLMEERNQSSEENFTNQKLKSPSRVLGLHQYTVSLKSSLGYTTCEIWALIKYLLIVIHNGSWDIIKCASLPWHG